MSVDALAIVAENRLFAVEPCPDNSGVRFMQTDPDGRRKWTASIIDCGDEFSLAMGSCDGIRLSTFKPTEILRMQSGKLAPLSVEKQIEIDAPYRKIIVRYFYNDETPSAVVVGYINKDEDVVHCVALCQANHGSLMISIAK